MSFTHTKKEHTGITMTDIEQSANRVLEIAQLRKQEICDEDNGITDMQSFVVFERGDIYECRQSGVDGHPFESLPSVLESAFKDGLTKFDTVSIVVDSYVREGTKPPTDYRRGDLEHEYKNNPSTSVVEALTVCTYGYDGGVKARCTKYVYGDDGRPQFTAIDDKDSQMSSEYVDFVMSKYIQWCKESSQ